MTHQENCKFGLITYEQYTRTSGFVGSRQIFHPCTCTPPDDTQRLEESLRKQFCFYMQDRGDLQVGYVFGHIADWWIKKIQEAEQEIMKKLRENRYCCKYQTIKKEDFCDHCISPLPLLADKE